MIIGEHWINEWVHQSQFESMETKTTNEEENLRQRKNERERLI